jgi:hypothetical protein
MKQIILVVMLVISSISTAQIQISDTFTPELVGEYKLLGKSYAKIEKGKSLYIFTYRDEKYTTMDNYKTFYFKESDFDALYDMFYNLEGIEAGTKKTVDLDNGDQLFFTYKKTFGKVHYEVLHQSKSGVVGFIRYLTQKQINKLFGKK